ncbi:MAG TPA: DUF1697 domain-containing protein [Thermoplasmata archaeon]|nr:DUF1697 domain-containing protein [Thermoplasmata archaeon]
MHTYIGLIRAVNVSGFSTVRMDTLRGVLAEMGLEDVRTLSQSGNFVFRSDERDPVRLEHQIEGRIARRLPLRTDLFVRTPDEWKAMVERNPFPKQAAESPSRLLAVVLKSPPTADRWKALDGANRGPEQIHGVERTAYIDYPNGVGRSRLTIAMIEKHLGTRGTARNWNTVLKLEKVVSEAEELAEVSP